MKYMELGIYKTIRVTQLLFLSMKFLSKLKNQFFFQCLNNGIKKLIRCNYKTKEHYTSRVDHNSSSPLISSLHIGQHCRACCKSNNLLIWNKKLFFSKKELFEYIILLLLLYVSNLLCKLGGKCGNMVPVELHFLYLFPQNKWHMKYHVFCNEIWNY